MEILVDNKQIELSNKEVKEQEIKDINSTDDELYLKSLEAKVSQCISGPHVISYNEVFQKVSSSVKAGIIPAFISRENTFLKKVQLLPQKVYVDSSLNQLSLAKREPKFVPYEPYKACVELLIPANTRKKVCQTGKNAKNNKVQPTYRSQVINAQSQNQHGNEAKLVSELKSELQCMKKEMLSLNQILAAQSQVNNDLKKLLVASLGEDVQEKVQCLTEERARMAKMIRKYSEKVDLDYEEKERISIQCDVWKSKFHACSLLLDELSDSNLSNIHHLREANEALSMLLEERNVAYPLLLNAYKQAYQVQETFDPLHSECPVSGSLESTDSLSLSVALSSMAENIRNRLVGSMGLVPRGAPLPPETKTPGENLAIQAARNCNALLTANASLPVARRSVLASKFGVDKRLTFNCCSHCNGEVILV